jgi:hypothetical protein
VWLKPSLGLFRLAVVVGIAGLSLWVALCPVFLNWNLTNQYISSLVIGVIFVFLVATVAASFIAAPPVNFILPNKFNGGNKQCSRISFNQEQLQTTMDGLKKGT